MIHVVEPTRIARILSKCCEAQLRVILRVPGETKIAVKGFAEQLQQVDSNLPASPQNQSVIITGISERARAFLADKKDIQVEFVLMSIKVTFLTDIIKIRGNRVQVRFPQQIDSHERRKDNRIATSQDAFAFVRMPSWQPDLGHPASIPVVADYPAFRGLLKIVDVSASGIGIETPFPGVATEEALWKEKVIHNSEIIFPMARPIVASIEIRWERTAFTQTESSKKQTNKTLKYKYGCLFVEPSENLQAGIQRFFQFVNQAGAI